jgi:hypothetical protein
VSPKLQQVIPKVSGIGRQLTEYESWNPALKSRFSIGIIQEFSRFEVGSPLLTRGASRLMRTNKHTSWAPFYVEAPDMY